MKLVIQLLIFTFVFSYAHANQGKTCFSSMNNYWKSTFGDNYSQDDNLISTALEGDDYGKYIFAIDNTPSRNPIGTILRKEADDTVCVIATEIWADGVHFEFSQNGSITSIDTWNFVYNPYRYPTTKILLKPDENGIFWRSKCEIFFLLSGKSKIYPCDADPDINDIYNKPDLELIPPSFDCRKSKLNVEKTICNNVKLAVLDLALSFNYKNLTSTIVGEKREQLRADQRRWLKQRNVCTTEKCIDESYRHRLDELCHKYPVVSRQVFECVSSEDILF